MFLVQKAGAIQVAETDVSKASSAAADPPCRNPRSRATTGDIKIEGSSSYGTYLANQSGGTLFVSLERLRQSGSFSCLRGRFPTQADESYPTAIPNRKPRSAC